MEEALRGWSRLLGLRCKGTKSEALPEQDYEPYLREMLLRAYEKGAEQVPKSVREVEP